MAQRLNIARRRFKVYCKECNGCMFKLFKIHISNRAHKLDYSNFINVTMHTFCKVNNTIHILGSTLVHYRL